MVFTREKNDTSNQNRERCFFTCEKNDTSNQKPLRCVRQNFRLLLQLAAPLRTHSTRKEHGNTWLYIAIHGNTWQYMVIHGYTW